MIELNVIPNGDRCWPDLVQKPFLHNEHTKISIARLPKGCKSGLSSVAIRLDMIDGKIIVAELPMKLFLACVESFVLSEIADRLNDTQ